jgi:hypothetical protein
MQEFGGAILGAQGMSCEGMCDAELVADCV